MKFKISLILFIMVISAGAERIDTVLQKAEEFMKLPADSVQHAAFKENMKARRCKRMALSVASLSVVDTLSEYTAEEKVLIRKFYKKYRGMGNP